MTERPVGVRECARQLGLSHSTISRQLAAGVFRNLGTDKVPLLLVSEVREARARGLDQSKQRGPEAPLNAPPLAAPDAPDGGPTYQGARGRREAALAEKAELELKRLRGETLDRAEVTEAAFGVGQMLREALETRRPGLAQRLAGLEPGAILAALQEADEQHLRAFADAVENRFAAPEAES